MSYKFVKDYLYEKLIEFVTPIQVKYAEISDEYVDNLLAKNAKIVNEVANMKMQKIYKAIGF